MIEGVRELQQATADGWDTLAVLRYRSRRDMLAPIAEAAGQAELHMIEAGRRAAVMARLDAALQAGR